MRSSTARAVHKYDGSLLIDGVATSFSTTTISRSPLSLVYLLPSNNTAALSWCLHQSQAGFLPSPASHGCSRSHLDCMPPCSRDLEVRCKSLKCYFLLFKYCQEFESMLSMSPQGHKNFPCHFDVSRTSHATSMCQELPMRPRCIKNILCGLNASRTVNVKHSDFFVWAGSSGPRTIYWWLCTHTACVDLHTCNGAWNCINLVLIL
jgi:hypothetical protein